MNKIPDMIKQIIFQLAIAASFGLLMQCKDDNTITPGGGLAKTCMIEQETTNLVSNEATWSYEYTQDGFPEKITRRDKFNNETDIVDIFGDRVVKTKMMSGSPTGTAISITYEGDYLRSSPPRAFESITMNGMTTTNYEIFLFTYGAEGRIIFIAQQTPNVFNDLEWELTISYNAAGNVTKLEYEFLTGPRHPRTTIEVDGYDTHPTPHAAVPGWKFLMYNYTWNNYDPLPVIEALSKNNPLHFTYYADGIKKSETTSIYEYNEDGFPTRRTNTSKNENGESTNSQTFSYKCE